jgi:23S rRNA pseudouridine1911/1915/1917 synthase
MKEPQIVFEDEVILAINKPAGWIVNKASTTGDNPVLQVWLENNINELQFKDPQTDFQKRAGIAHRLDKPTSGILLTAKTEGAFSELQRQFKDREIQKEYLALVHGDVEPKEGNIKAPVGRLPWNRERFGILPGGRAAETDYQVVKTFEKEKEKYSLLALQPKTGRTHQIRIHTKYIHHPIVADTFYAGRKTARKDLKWCPRLFLHAHKITFTHPSTNQKVTLEAPLAEDLQEVLSMLI